MFNNTSELLDYMVESCKERGLETVIAMCKNGYRSFQACLPHTCKYVDYYDETKHIRWMEEPLTRGKHGWLEGTALFVDTVSRHNATQQNTSVDMVIINWHQSSGRTVNNEDYKRIRVRITDSEKVTNKKINNAIDQYLRYMSEK